MRHSVVMDYGSNTHTVFSIYWQLVLGTEVNKDFSSRARYLLHADGKSIWFDKSFTVLVSPDGRMGFNCEHSYADAPVLAHIIEYNLTYEWVYRSYISSLPHNPNFWQPWETSLSKILWEKEKMLVTSNSSFSHNVFYPIKDRNHHFSNMYFIVFECF